MNTHLKHLNYMLGEVKNNIEKILFVGPSNTFLYNKENSLEKVCMEFMKTLFVVNNRQHQKLFSSKGLEVIMDDVCNLKCNNSFVLIENPAGINLKNFYNTTAEKVCEIAKNLAKNDSFYFGLIGIPYEGQITENLIKSLYQEINYIPITLKTPGETEISLLLSHF